MKLLIGMIGLGLCAAGAVVWVGVEVNVNAAVLAAVVLLWVGFGRF